MEDFGPTFARLPEPLFTPLEDLLLPLEELLLPPDYAIAKIEVTQSQQCLDTTRGDTACADNELPLVADRLTWVRVYVRSGAGVDVPNVPVRLNVSRNTDPWLTIDGVATAKTVLDRDIRSVVEKVGDIGES